ncbi:MAG TPA: hypothetical protein VME44_15345 [Streptosporangiaceae bacterium]|nr:hypothetical protein [Streptosporangiaceae bacterium]
MTNWHFPFSLVPYALAEELQNRLGELGGAGGRDVVAGNHDESPVRQQGSERVRRRAAADPVARDDEPCAW